MNFVITKGRSEHGILTHDNLNICNDGKGIFFIDETVSCSSEDNIGDELSLLVDSVVLADGHSYREVVILEVWADVFVRENHIYAHYRVLGIFSSLQ